MSLKHLTQYHFSNEYGVTGTLAADPTFADTKKGDEYARFAIYCKAIDANDDNKKNHHSKESDTNDIPLIAYVRVFNEDLLIEVEQLKKGYFVNFTYDDVTWNLGIDTKTNELRVNPTFVANTLSVRHIPGEKKARQSNQKSETNGDNDRVYNTRSRRKK